jgi:hypothetical protein
MTEVTYHCINFNDRVRNVPKFIIEIFGTFLTLSLKLMQWSPFKIVSGDPDTSFCPCFCFVHTIAQFSRMLRFSHIYCQIFRISTDGWWKWRTTALTKGAIQGPFHKSLVAIGPVVSEEKIKMWNVDGRRTKSDDNSSHGLKARLI